MATEQALRGVDLLRQVNDGLFEEAPSEYLIQTREKVSQALDEMIEIGARIRPLIVHGKRVGWVRGVHLAERRGLKRWLTDDFEFIEQLLLLGTTFTIAEIRDLTITELRSLLKLVQEMSESDLKLYGFVSAFVTTSTSEQLHFSHGKALTSYRDRSVTLPDGKQVRIMLPPDQAKLWAALCNYRMQAKSRLEASMNAVLTIRPMVGRGADPLTADLKAIARNLQTDALSPWRETVHYREEKNLDDGWGHVSDDSREGIVRQLQGMLENDKHERVFSELDALELQRAEKRKQEIEQKINRMGGPGFRQSAALPMTRDEVQKYSTRFKSGRLRSVTHFDQEAESSPVDRLAKYR